MSITDWLNSKTDEEKAALGVSDIAPLPIRYITPEESKQFKAREGRGLSIFEPRIDSFGFISRRSDKQLPHLRTEKEQEMHNQKRAGAIDFIQDYFNLNPSASVDDCARVASAAKIQASRALISSVRQRLKLQAPTTTEAEPVVERQLKVVQPLPDPAVVAAEAEALRKNKEAYLNELLDKSPGMAVNKIQELLKQKFGGSLNPMYILETMKVAQEIAGIPPKTKAEPAPKTTQAPTFVAVRPAPVAFNPPTDFATQMVPPAVPPVPVSQQRMLTWSDGKQTNYEVASLEDVQKKVLTLMGKGIDTKSIKLWKPTNFKVSIDIE